MASRKLARSHRWVRSRFRTGRRRRRRLLALTAREWTIGFHPGALCAPSAELDPHLLETSMPATGGPMRFWPGSAREVQRRRARVVVRPACYGPGRVARLLQPAASTRATGARRSSSRSTSRTPGPLTSFLSMPEWWFVVPCSRAGSPRFEWTHAADRGGRCSAGLGAPLARAIVAARRSPRCPSPTVAADRVRLRSVIALCTCSSRSRAGWSGDMASRCGSAGCSRLVTPRARRWRRGRALARADRAPSRPRVVLREQGQTLVRAETGRWDLELRQGWLAAPGLAGTERAWTRRQLTRFRRGGRDGPFRSRRSRSPPGWRSAATPPMPGSTRACSRPARSARLAALTDYGGARATPQRSDPRARDRQ